MVNSNTQLHFQFVFAVLALVIHSTTGISVDLQYSDAFKILYLAWFIYDTIQRYPVTYKILKTLLFLVLAFDTFTCWRFYGFPSFFKIFSVRIVIYPAVSIFFSNNKKHIGPSNFFSVAENIFIKDIGG